MRKIFLCLSISLLLIYTITWSYAIDQSLGLYFDFDHVDNNTIKDQSGKGNDGVINGNVKIVEGKYDNGVEFVGNIADKIIIPHNESLNPKDGAVTVMAWIYPTQFVGEWELAILKWQDANPAEFAYHLSLHNKRASLFVKPKNVAWLESIGGTVLTEKEWYHVASVADGVSTITVYLNGNKDGIANYDGTIADTTVDVCIGGKVDGALFPFHGKMDEVAILNRALSEDEIKQSMQRVVSSVEPNDKLAVTWSSIKAR